MSRYVLIYTCLYINLYIGICINSYDCLLNYICTYKDI